MRAPALRPRRAELQDVLQGPAQRLGRTWTECAATWQWDWMALICRESCKLWCRLSGMNGVDAKKACRAYTEQPEHYDVYTSGSSPAADPILRQPEAVLRDALHALYNARRHLCSHIPLLIGITCRKVTITFQ